MLIHVCLYLSLYICNLCINVCMCTYLIVCIHMFVYVCMHVLNFVYVGFKSITENLCCMYV